MNGIYVATGTRRYPNFALELRDNKTIVTLPDYTLLDKEEYK